MEQDEEPFDDEFDEEFEEEENSRRKRLRGNEEVIEEWIPISKSKKKNIQKASPKKKRTKSIAHGRSIFKVISHIILYYASSRICIFSHLFRKRFFESFWNKERKELQYLA